MGPCLIDLLIYPECFQNVVPIVYCCVTNHPNTEVKNSERAWWGWLLLVLGASAGKAQTTEAGGPFSSWLPHSPVWQLGWDCCRTGLAGSIIWKAYLWPLQHSVLRGDRILTWPHRAPMASVPVNNAGATWPFIRSLREASSPYLIGQSGHQPAQI